MQSVGISAEHHGCKLTLWRHFWRNHGRNQKQTQPRSEVHNFEPKSIIDQTRPCRSTPATTDARARTVGDRSFGRDVLDREGAAAAPAESPMESIQIQIDHRGGVEREELRDDEASHNGYSERPPQLGEPRRACAEPRIARAALRVQTSPIWTLPDLRPTRSETLPSGSR
jgi:hypothetical protein